MPAGVKTSVKSTAGYSTVGTERVNIIMIAIFDEIFFDF